MKNNLKKASLLLFTIITIFTANNTVFAEYKEGQYGPIITTGAYYQEGISTYVKGYKDKTTTFASYGLSIYSKKSDVFKDNITYYYHKINSTARAGLDLYCLDPTLSGDNSLYAFRILLSDVENKAPIEKAYDAALMSVLISDGSYAAKSIAIRALTAVWGKDMKYNTEQVLYRTYYGQASEWINNDAEIKADFLAIYNKYPNTTFHSLEEMSIYDDYSFSDKEGYNNKAVAYNLFKNAMRDAVKYADSEKVANVNDTSTTVGTVTKNIVNSKTEITKIVTHNFKLTNFTKDGNASFIINNVKYNNNYVGVSEPVIKEVKVNNQVISGTLTNKNLLEGIDDLSNVTINITLEFKGIEEDISCSSQPMAYTIDYNYDDTSLNDKFSNYIGVEWESTRTWAEKGKNYQRYISVEKVSNATDGNPTNGKNVKKDYNIELKDCNCDELREACSATNNYNSSACRELEGASCGCKALNLLCDLSNDSNNINCTQYSSQCSSCETTVSNEFQCCDINNKLVVIDETKIPPLKIEGPSDPVACFVNSTETLDEKGNSYTYKSNQYCNISCKEDYTMNLPTSQKLNSSRYFTFKMSISGTKTCYTNKIDIDKFNSDMVSIQNTMKSAYNTYKNSTDPEIQAEAAKTLTQAKKTYDQNIEDINNCTAWINNFAYDPDINYKYQEKYNHDKDNMELINGINKVDGNNASVWACSGSLIGNQYNSCSTNAKYNLSDLANSVSYTYYTTSNGKVEDNNILVYNKAYYVKKTATVNASYRPATLFYNVKGSGRVVDTPSSNTIPIENGLPVSRLTSRGIYEYNIKMSNLGEYYNNGTLGRLAGNKNSVLSKDYLSDYTNYDGTNITYNCSYLVNMGNIKDGMLNCNFGCTGDSCDFECVGPGCENYCDGPNCDFNCIGTGCLYNEGEGDSYFEKTISLNNIFPDGTTSRNWNKDSGINGLANKASSTLEEIENKGESVYSETPILSITITPSSANEIAKYNSANQNEGGYANETLTCYKLGKYENGACFSEFIDDVLTNKYGTVKGLITNSNYRIKDNLTGQVDEYFVMWNDLSANGITPDSMVIGPSWK